MNGEIEFYIDQKSDVIIEIISGSCGEESCCGLQKLVPNTSEGAQEKHLPVVEAGQDIVTVKVGSVFHPMEDAHSIQWVMLQTQKGCQRTAFSPTSEPVAVFRLAEGDKPQAVYAYCNLHGLWKTEI